VRARLLGNLLIATQANAARAARAARARIYGRGLDDLEQLVAEIRDCPRQAVREAAAAYVSAAAHWDIVLGP
jgi:predicted Zn-dependent peptidase